MIGVGIPGLFFIIGIAAYVYGRIFGSSTADLSPSSRRLSRAENQPKEAVRVLKLIKTGTMNLGFVFKHGTVLAVESRSTSVDHQGKRIIVTDEDQKLLPLNPDATVVCASAGFVEDWEMMFYTIKGPALDTAETASMRAYAYIRKEITQEYLDHFKNETGQDLIAGKDCQLFLVNLDTARNVSRKKIIVEAIGSGAE